MLNQRFFITLLFSYVFCGLEEEGVRLASRCETCKILAIELQERLTETGKSHEIIEIGYAVDDVKPKKRTKYRKSELRLIESVENICDRILDYSLHKERRDSTRFAKGTSQTFKTLRGLVDKGVKVDLGIPYDLWNNPSVEVADMKNQCESLVEEFEDVIENWYYQHQERQPLMEYLCNRALSTDDRNCLREIITSQYSDDSQHVTEEGEVELGMNEEDKVQEEEEVDEEEEEEEEDGIEHIEL